MVGGYCLGRVFAHDCHTPQEKVVTSQEQVCPLRLYVIPLHLE
jgi:hypothetical protein